MSIKLRQRNTHRPISPGELTPVGRITAIVFPDILSGMDGYVRIGESRYKAEDLGYAWDIPVHDVESYLERVRATL